MQTTLKRIYDDPSCHQLKIEVPIRRTQAIEAILTGFRAASDLELHRGSVHDVANNIARSLYLQWAGYRLYQAAAPLGEQHLTHVQLCPGIGGHRYEFVFPDGLFPDECDVLCREMIGEDGDDLCRKRELLVTSTLATILHGRGIRLDACTVLYLHGKPTVGFGERKYSHVSFAEAVEEDGLDAVADYLIEQQNDLIRRARTRSVQRSGPGHPKDTEYNDFLRETIHGVT